MPVQVATSMMQGGLDLITPPISMAPGKAIASINYEPDVNGYTSMAGYERFNGFASPSEGSSPADIEFRRNEIPKVPGWGPVRGVWVFDGSVYAFRDKGTQAAPSANAGMYRSSPSGWIEQKFGTKLTFGAGKIAFTEGELVTGNSSGSVGRVDRMVVRSGVWNVTTPTAEGYLVISNITGNFTPGEILGSTNGALATAISDEAILLKAGGEYDFTNHNFYGAAERMRMYFTNSVDSAYEWTGTILTPIFTGVSSTNTIDLVELRSPATVDHATPTPAPWAEPIPIYAHTDGTSGNTGTDGDKLIMSAQFDAPAFIAHFKNHLFLAFTSGSVLNSSIGEPLQFVTGTGAGEIAFGDKITGMLGAANSALVIFATNRIEYLTGTDSSTWELKPVTDTSGAQPYTIQMMDAPTFLDDGGIRSLPTTPAFGDWRMGTMTQPVEPLVRKKRDSRINAKASMRIKAKDQYRLFWDEPDTTDVDNIRGFSTGITTYIGRKNPESMPFKLPIRVYCSCSGELDFGRGDRLFVGAYDGYVYEMNRGTSFDGAVIDSYIRLPFTHAGSSQQHTRWTKVSFELSTPDDITMGVAFHTDYARSDGGALFNVDVDGGASIISTDAYSEIDWTQPVEGRLEYHLAGIGPNIAATLVHSADDKQAHTISSQTYNFSRRGLKR